MSRNEAASDGDSEKLYHFDSGISRDFLARKEASTKAFFQTLDRTKEWAENNYYRLPIGEQHAELVDVNDFWLDWAQHDPQTPFRSSHFAQASQNFTEAMFSLALLDLPFESPKHEVTLVEQTIKIRTAGPAIVMREQIQPASENAEPTPILISQNFFRNGERYRMVNGQQVDLFVTAEFLPLTVYGGELVVTNPTSSSQKLDILIQLPVGAIPVANGKSTQSIRVQLEAYNTQKLEYYFYFPVAGEFAQLPAQVTQGDELVAAAPPMTFRVVDELSQIDRESWDYVSQRGSNDDVLAYLEAQNLQTVRLERIAFRLSDPEFFEQVVRTLRQRHYYDQTIWSYAVKHQRAEAIREFLEHADAFVQQCGVQLDSPWLVIDPVVRESYEHLEYHPLVNARAHQVGQQRQILNDRFFEQYERWLNLVSYQRSLADQDRLVATYYLLLQDRIGEALGQFQQIDANRLHTRLQYDYCLAYLSLSQSDMETARAIANRYTDYQVDRWRNAFAVLTSQLDEIEGKNGVLIDPSDRNQIQDRMAATEASFDFEIDAKTIKLNSRQLERVEVRYYLMDIELLFSRNPFVQQHQGQFSYIAPNAVETLELDPTSGRLEHELPAELQNQNILIEIEGAGKRQSRPYYSNALSVQLIENYGQLRVTSPKDDAPLSTVYCKVYARTKDGQTIFYKDGYTDLRGRFDYATLSTNMLDTVDRFAVLILSDESGATVREVAPPQR